MTSLLRRSSISDAPTIKELPNGAIAIAEQMPVAAVNFNLWLHVGSAWESDEINGMAHFLEHMVFKGTDRLESGEFEQAVEGRGAVTNAATSQEYTHYYITAAPQDFAALAPLQLDVVLNPSIPDAAFEKERLVVLEEIRRAEDNPRRRTFQRAMGLGFASLPYRRSVLGPAGVIEQLKPQQMRDFHAQWYRPPSLTAVVVGNLPTEQLLDIVSENLAESDQGSSFSPAFPRLLTPEPSFEEIERQEWEDEGLQQARLVMLWRVPGLQQLSETYALDIIAAVLGQGKMSRLFRDLREDRSLVSHISATNLTQAVQGAFSISAQLPTANAPAVEAAVQQHLRQLQAESISLSELTRIRTQVANRFIFSNERPSDRANLYGYYYSQLGDLQPALSYPDRLQSLTREDIQAAAQRYLSADAYGIALLKPPQSL